MSTDIVMTSAHMDLAAQVEYAKTIAVSDLLPAAYRGKPANVLIATNLGSAMGLTPAESLYRIHVIQGRPTASAELIAANVRKAGHRLRVQGDESQAVAQIIRTDDPEFVFESRWDMDRARRMDLANKDGWKKQPGTMLKWRAITEVARLACPEALYGVAYIAEEIEDSPRAAAAASGSTLSAASFTQVKHPEVIDAEVADETGEAITGGQRKAIFAAFTTAGFTTDARSSEGRDARLAYMSQVLGEPVASTNDLTTVQASRVLDALNADAESLTAAEPADLLDVPAGVQ